MKSKQIIVGMSGGVDSSIAAFLLKEAGHQVRGIFMKNWEGDDTAEYCPASADLADAQAVCDRLDIPLQFVNFADQYWERVFTYFLDEYRAGRTPNPDILCNKEIKFRAFLDYAKTQGADFIATGHYVRKKQDVPHTYLCKGLDPLKDQSYFLHALNEDQLAQSLFPVGDLEKTTVRDIAKKLNLSNHAKKDSTGICFIGERRFKQFLNDFLPATPGMIETEKGEVIGKHDGLMFLTIGQRQGLNIGGLRDKAQAPWYVAGKDMSRNVLIVVQGEHALLYKSELHAKDIHWINDAPTTWPLDVMAKTRYRQADQACRVYPLENGHHRIEFEQAQRAVTPGQFIVFYREDICLGGGIIEN